MENQDLKQEQSWSRGEELGSPMKQTLHLFHVLDFLLERLNR